MNILKQLEEGVESKSSEETQAFAEALAAALPTASILTLEGDLGAGKTTFVKGLAKGFGIQELVTSPSFNILNTYIGHRALLHVDAYRVDGNSNILDELMLEDFMIEPYCLAIEWPRNLGSLPWETTIALELTILPNSDHSIRASKMT